MPRLRRFLFYVGAFTLFIFCTGPIFLSLLGSIVPERAMFAGEWFREGVNLDNYRFVLTGEIPREYRDLEGNIFSNDAARQVPRSMFNSTVVAFSVMILNIVMGAPAAYGFARLRFRGKTPSFMVIIFSRLVPSAALAVPFYLVIQELGLLGTKLALVLVHTVLTIPFTVFILSVFFRRLPIELEDAALVDGCNRFQVFYKVVLRMSGASIFATGLFAFMLSYSEFLFAGVLSGDVSQQTLSVTLASIVANFDFSWGMMHTSIFLTVVPSVILVVFIWRFVVERVVEGAVRG
ncbi:MAG: carbohydrate ABC transporter permease [Alphaproteobacteria bacterium]